MSDAGSNPNNKDNAILSDEALKEISAGMNGPDAQFMAENLYKQLTGSNGPAELEKGYTEEEVITALKNAFRAIKIKGMPS